MYLVWENRLINMFNAFMKERILKKEISYDEMLWQIRAIALGSHILENNNDICIEKYLLSIKNKVRIRYSKNELDIKFLCDTGEALHYLNSKIHQNEKFQKSYYGIVEWWIENYIKQMRDIDAKKINLSYENGLCRLIRYCLLDKKYFANQLNDLSLLLAGNIESALDRNEINLGMKHGIGGWLNTINRIEDEVCDGFKDYAKLLINIYTKEKILRENLVEWPAIIKANKEALYTISDNWNYGPSMILFNLLNSKHLGNLERDEYYQNLIYLSYRPIGDLGLISCDFYTGYAGCLNIYIQCHDKYKESCFNNMKNKIINILLDNNINNYFMFYRYEYAQNNLLKIMDYKSYLVENYQVYCTICGLIKK